MWISLLFMIIPAMTLTLVDNKVRYVEKLYSRLKIKNRVFRILLFIIVAVIIGILGVLVQRGVMRISDNERLAEAARWIIFGACIPFLLGGVSPGEGAGKE